MIHSFITDGKFEAYFRGRKLRGQEIQVPQGYSGVIVKEVGKEKAASRNIERGGIEGYDGDEELEETTVLNEVGSFKNILIWNHEDIFEGDNAFVKGLSEWIGFAEAVSHVLPGMWLRDVHGCCWRDLFSRCTAHQKEPLHEGGQKDW